MTTSNELMLIDLSAVAVPIWMMSTSNPDPNGASIAIVARVRALTSNHPHAAICCDSGRSFRNELAPTYKANRPASEAPMHHQIGLAREQLVADGFPVWAVRGFEADDVIASAVRRSLEMPDVQVLVLSSDKDLLALVGPRVRAMSARDGAMLDAEAVWVKFGVHPAQVPDYLCLVGDSSDNVKGANGIGPKKAAELLTKYGTLDAVYIALATRGSEFKPGVATALQEFRQRLDETRALITLRSDVPIPFEEIAAERVAKDAEAFGAEEGQMTTTQLPEPTVEPVQPKGAAAGVEAAQGEVIDLRGSAGGAVTATPANGSASALNHVNSGAMVVRQPEVLPAPVEWERQLEPRSINEAIDLARHMYASRLFSAYGTAQGVLATMLAGRELGMQAMASLRGFDIIDGRPTFKADLIRALVLKSGKAKYFRCTARSNTLATFVTQRGDEPPIDLTYTIEDGKTAWSKAEDGWAKSGWGKNPADMLVARAGAKLARLVYPDVVHGLYSPEEFD